LLSYRGLPARAADVYAAKFNFAATVPRAPMDPFRIPNRTGLSRKIAAAAPTQDATGFCFTRLQPVLSALSGDGHARILPGKSESFALRPGRPP